MVFFKPFNRFVLGAQFNFFLIFFISAYNTSFSPSFNLRLLNSGLPLPTILFTKLITSVPDPGSWGKVNPFRILESPKGTTIHDPNFVQVIPGYSPENNLDSIKVVPNPYIVHSDFNETEYKRKIRFTRLPQVCTITIFTISGEKVRELSHNNSVDGNTWWDLRSYNNQEIAPGLYIYVIETPGGDKKIDKFAVVR